MAIDMKNASAGRPVAEHTNTQEDVTLSISLKLG
jgi:hypothetical protein